MTFSLIASKPVSHIAWLKVGIFQCMECRLEFDKCIFGFVEMVTGRNGALLIEIWILRFTNLLRELRQESTSGSILQLDSHLTSESHCELKETKSLQPFNRQLS